MCLEAREFVHEPKERKVDVLRFTRTIGLAAVLAAILLWSAMPAPAAEIVNAATGSIDGTNGGTLENGDGTGQARIRLQSVQLGLTKLARDLTGAVLAEGAAVSPGQEIWFVLQVDNTTPFPALDVRITDLLDDSAFTYVSGTLARTTTPTGASESAIWASAWTPMSDAIGAPDDHGSAVDTGGPPGPDRITSGAAPPQPNVPLDVPGSSLTAIRFRVRVN